MSTLEMYELYGFKFFPCNADKTPGTKGFLIEGDSRCRDEKNKCYKPCYDWKQPENQISRNIAEELQKTGQMIGAWIPEGIIIIDLDKHEGKQNGKIVFNGIIKKYNVPLKIGETFAVKTGGGGLHIFFTCENEYKQNRKDESIDLRTHKGYVIAAGSPGYSIEWDCEIMPLPMELEQWLIDCENAPEKNKTEIKTPTKDQKKNKKLSVLNLRKILAKIPAADFRNNDKWIEFIFSAVATCGEYEEVYQALTEWSATDPLYKDEQRNVAKRIKASHENGGITAGSFIHILREQNLPDKMVSGVLKSITANEVLVISEKAEKKLPFNDPDYLCLSELPFTVEFFNFPKANSAAASILENALKGKVISVESEEKKSFYFDGNKWQELFDIYSLIYSILYRTIKIYYANLATGSENYENFIKCVRSINDKNFKDQTWKEFISREGIYNFCVEWDAPEISESITCSDYVIDFSKYEKIKRKGNPNEFRRSYINCKADSILNSQIPLRFIQFLNEVFPDEDTFKMAKYVLSLSISGNASKRLFQLWHGGGRNGKSVLLELIHYVLGNEKAYKHETDLIVEQKWKSEKYDQINFRGKYFCYSSEVNKYQKLNIERIKDLTSYETINARQIFQKRQTFRPTWQLVFVSNDLPEFTADFAIIDRIMILPFEVRFYKTEEEKQKFIERDHINEKFLKPAIEAHKLRPELEKERTAIINYLIDCYIELQTNYEGMIPVSARSLIKKQKYVYENDETAIFVKEYCYIDLSNEKLFVSTEDISECYRDFIGKSKMSDRVVIKNLMEFEPGLTQTSRMIIVTNNYGSESKKQKRGLKYIGLLTDEYVSELFDKNKSKKQNENWEEKEIPF
jgi:hypothetical protein